MSDGLAQLLAQAQAWFEAAVAADWLDETDRARLDAVERDTPADLFTRQETRPLVVALFGGTGVGKSSLLNRLAGTDVARVGVERPTSRDVTIYVHTSVELAALPKNLPLHTVRVERHSSAALRDVLWLDAPDIDSTEEANRRAALAWLPHADLVCYVVSPERYRDDVGWRVLHTRGHKHGWVFVLNHWDEGDPQQVADLTRILQAAGFESPRVLRTSCRPGSAIADEFDELQAVVAELLVAHGVRELQRLGIAARVQELRDAVQNALPKLGTDETWRRLASACAERWRTTSDTIAEGTEWALRAAAGRFAAAEGGWWRPVQQALATIRRADVPAAADAGGRVENHVADAELDRVAGALWDEWTRSKVTGCLDAVEIIAGHDGTAVSPLRRRLDDVAASVGTLVTECAGDHLRAALARPGSALSRLARRVTGFLTTFLPAMAVLWVAYAAIVGYHAATRGAGPFLGTPFAIHSAVVILIAWLVPFVLDRLLRPSSEKTALRALRAGLQAALSAAENDFDAALETVAADARRQRERAEVLLNQAARLMEARPGELTPVVERLLMRTAGKESVAAAPK